MKNKVISFSLSASSINAAIRELRDYRADLERKCRRVRELVAERIAWSASTGFTTALVSDVVKGPRPQNNVQVRVEHGDTVSIVIAEGEQAVFIEYGAGKYHNGDVGKSPHEWGQRKGYLIGTYGKGQGAHDQWAFYLDESKRSKKEVSVTRGTPAAKPMYNGMKEAIQALEEIMREVFGG